MASINMHQKKQTDEKLRAIVQQHRVHTFRILALSMDLRYKKLEIEEFVVTKVFGGQYGYSRIAAPQGATRYNYKVQVRGMIGAALAAQDNDPTKVNKILNELSKRESSNIQIGFIEDDD
jgi:hypothetical protein